MILFDFPCESGHYDCSVTEFGPCSDEHRQDYCDHDEGITFDFQMSTATCDKCGAMLEDEVWS